MRVSGKEMGESRAPSPAIPAWRALVAVAAVCLFAVCSVGLMHDWLAWNSARWELGKRALAGHAKPEDIEGGLEWDGWYTEVPRYTLAARSWGLALPGIHHIFPKVTGKLALSFSELPDSVVIGRQSYDLWLGPGRQEFLLVKYEPR
jgi:hypothetical protein